MGMMDLFKGFRFMSFECWVMSYNNTSHLIYSP